MGENNIFFDLDKKSFESLTARHLYLTRISFNGESDIFP